MTKTIPALTILSAFIFLLVSCTKDDIELNKVPVADAGESKTITLPEESATLAGTGTDSDGEIVAYLWSQVSGVFYHPCSLYYPGLALQRVAFPDRDPLLSYRS